MQCSDENQSKVEIEGETLLLTHTRSSVCWKSLGESIRSPSSILANAGVCSSSPEGVVGLAAERMENKNKNQVGQIVADRSILAIRVVLVNGLVAAAKALHDVHTTLRPGIHPGESRCSYAGYEGWLAVT